jgi:hypothetical protein
LDRLPLSFSHRLTRVFSFRGTDFIRIADGKLVEFWNCQQIHEFVLQFGVKLIIPSEAKGTT